MRRPSASDFSSSHQVSQASSELKTTMYLKLIRNGNFATVSIDIELLFLGFEFVEAFA